LKASYLTIIAYLQVTGKPILCRGIISMTTDVILTQTLVSSNY